MRAYDDGLEPVSLGEVRVVRRTDKAVLFDGDELDDALWVPNSCIHDDSEVWGNDPATGETDSPLFGELVVKKWWARKENLTDE